MSAPAPDSTLTATAVENAGSTRGMTLWRLETARLLRTHRWMILVGVYLLSGLVGALTARFFNELMGRAGGDITIIAPEPRPVDGIIQFVSNAGQLGLLAVVVVAAGALAVDAHPQRSTFLRTRLISPGHLVVAPYVVTTTATVGSLLLGTGLAWGLTASLVGPLPATPMLVGTLYGALYLGFVVAVVAAAAALVRSQIATVFTAVGVLLTLPVVALVDVVRPWLPSELLLAVVELIQGAPASDYLRATIVTVLATPGLLWFAAERLEAREL